MEKKRKWFIRGLALLLAVLMILSVLWIIIDSTNAEAVSKTDLKNLKDKKEALKQQRQDIAAKIASKEYEQMTIMAKKEVLDEQIELTNLEIENVSALIVEYGNLIAEKEVEVAEAQAREDDQMEKYKERIRAMEENGPISYYSVLFDAVNFSDFLGRLDFVSEIMEYDELIYNQLVQAKQETIAAKTELEEMMAEQEATRAELLEYEADLDRQIAEASALIAQLDDEIGGYQADYDEIRQAEEKLQEQIDKMAEELRKQEEAAAAARVVSTGTYIWPSQSSRYVTSRFGTRFHPIYKVYKTHNGIDIGAGYGTNVLAADSGVVVTSSYDSGYGNYIVINHGGGRMTVYAHLSKRLVSVGQNVTQGQVIGRVGSTGVSTGPHLHFEVRVNGSRVNPLNYFSNYTISPNA